MDSNIFENIRRAVKEQHFKNKKLDALKTTLSCSSGYLSGKQVAQLISEFNFDEGKSNAVKVCAPRMYSITCEQAVSILDVFGFDNDKIKALEDVAPHISDNNLAALESAFNFESKRKLAREILRNRPQPGPQPGFLPQAGPYPVDGPSVGGFPGMVPQPGGYPSPATQPGPQPGCPPQVGPHPSVGSSTGGFPGMVPQSGGYPSPASYAYPGSEPFPYGAAPAQYPNGAMPPPGGVLGEMMTATAGAMMKGMSDMFGPPAPQYPPPGGYPQPGYPYPLPPH